jgi:metallo-beta-lactamase family protein
MISIQFCGAAGTVTGSQHLIEVNGRRILLDCGMFQGRRAESRERNKHFPYDPAGIDAVVLSHAHIDHSGNIPNLTRQGYRGEILCTFATRDLCAAMLVDSAHIQENDAEFLNKKARRRGEALIKPLYTQDDAIASLDSFASIGYDRPRQIAPGVTATLSDAGHMLGSAFVTLDIEDFEDKRQVRIVFSGDIGRPGLPILRDPRQSEGADVLIMESTYGDRKHPPYEDDIHDFERIIGDAYKRGGKVLIPAFAVGRTQQVVYTLHQLARAGDLPNVPVYVDSPLATDVTNVFRMHPECFDEEIRAFINQENGRALDPFGFSRLHYTRSVEESKQLNFLPGSAIIIAASGMMEAGRILHHLKNNIEDPNTTVLVVGWQAEHTLGRRLVEGAPHVRIFGEMYDNRARTEVLNGFSGHADADGLLDWVGGMTRRPKQAFLVHGEPEPAAVLAARMSAEQGIPTTVPVWKQKVTV